MEILFQGIDGKGEEELLKLSQDKYGGISGPVLDKTHHAVKQYSWCKVFISKVSRHCICNKIYETIRDLHLPFFLSPVVHIR